MEKAALPKGLEEILERYKNAGKKAYLVGGCVRNGLMGIPVSDYDIATDALPDETASLFADCKVIPTGIKHGTVTVICNGFKAEITTFRKEGAYSDFRRPDGVTFTADPKEDAARRDFTVNAMFYSPSEGLLDFYGGKDDIKNGILRTVGSAQRRFSEDALRILRAMRFSAQLGFEVEEETDAAMKSKAHLVGKLAAERIFSELGLLFASEKADGINKRYYQVYEHIFAFKSDVPQVDKYPRRFRFPVFTAEYGGSIEGAIACAESLKADNGFKKAVKAAALAIYGEGIESKAKLARCAMEYGLENAAMMCMISKEKGLLVTEKYGDYLKRLGKGDLPLHIKDLDVKVESLPLKGKKLGVLLQKLYDYAHNSGINTSAALLKKAAEIIEREEL